MYQIHGLNISSNTTKTVFVAEALGIDYDYIEVDLIKGEQKSVAHIKRHPMGKLPTLTHDEKTLFESNAICAYLADQENSALYSPSDKYLRAKIDQWLLFFTNHLGRWLNSYAFERVAKVKYGLGTPNKDVEAEAHTYILEQLPIIETQLSNHTYLVGSDISIADYVAYAYFENAGLAEIRLDDYPKLAKWYSDLANSTAIKQGSRRLGLI